METSSNEKCIILALQAIQKHPKLSLRKAAQIYKVSRTTPDTLLPRNTFSTRYYCQITGTELEEMTIIQKVIPLISQGFPIRISGIKDMANLLCCKRNASLVGKNWAENFVR